jgi:pimeloyl-ACP methyl ester carboxylesterase
MPLFLAAAPYLGSMRRGGGHPVLVLPPFLAGDESTIPLRAVLRSQGFAPYGWELGRNLGLQWVRLEDVERQLERVGDARNQEVSLVGWSLGGMYARMVARRRPELVRQVITLGSPFRLRDGDGGTAVGLYRKLNRGTGTLLDELAVEHSTEPLPVPSTAVYTTTDGVNRWHLCINADRPRSENVRVRGSHAALGLNPAAVYVVSDRLSLPQGEWRPFEPPRALRRLYGKPAWWLHADERRSKRPQSSGEPITA